METDSRIMGLISSDLTELLEDSEREFLDLVYYKKEQTAVICSKMGLADANAFRKINAEIIQKLAKFKAGNNSDAGKDKVEEIIDDTEPRISVAIKNLDVISKGADGIFIKPELEKFLVKFLYHKKQMAEVEKDIKSHLETKALELDPDFKSLFSDNVTIYYSMAGSKYMLDESVFYDESTGKETREFLKSKNIVDVRVTLKAEAIEDYVKETGQVPVGIKIKDRKKSITFKLKRDAEALERQLEDEQREGTNNG